MQDFHRSKKSKIINLSERTYTFNCLIFFITEMIYINHQIKSNKYLGLIPCIRRSQEMDWKKWGAQVWLVSFLIVRASTNLGRISQVTDKIFLRTNVKACCKILARYLFHNLAFYSKHTAVWKLVALWSTVFNRPLNILMSLEIKWNSCPCQVILKYLWRLRLYYCESLPRIRHIMHLISVIK